MSDSVAAAAAAAAGIVSHRPVVSPDGNFLAVIVPEFGIQIIKLADASFISRPVKRIILPKAVQTFVSNADVLRWSPETVLVSGPEDDETSAATGTECGIVWILLSDGARIIALSTGLRYNQVHSLDCNDDEPSRSSNVVADYQVGTQFGKITLVDFIFNHRYAIVLFETNTHASIMSLTRPERHDITNTKYPDSKAFAQSSKNQYFALLLRAKGQDQVTVFSSRDDTFEDVSTFWPRTADAQGLQWSPNGDPVILVWDSASYGVKVTFFTAMGHSLRQLDLSTLAPSPSHALGVIILKWYSAGQSTILAVADGQKSVLVRRQDNQNMRLQTLVSLVHPEIVDGSQYVVWLESLEGRRDFVQQKIAFDSGQQDAGGEVDVLAINASGTTLCSRITTLPKTVWIWQAHSHRPSSAMSFRESVKQVLWHPTSKEILLIITAQKEPRVYVMYDDSQPPAIADIPIQTEKLGKWDGAWLPNAIIDRHPFMLRSPTAFEVGFLESKQGRVIFESILSKNIFTEEEEGDVSVVLTPSRSS